ncbi:MAG: hypothetical protein K2Q01_06340, partial [Rickettsiales bacterium]|nr:hypothetical protein [Rickettsiales bacterium]
MEPRPMTPEEECLFKQLALPDTLAECRVRRHGAMNRNPNNEQTLRWAVEDLKLLGINRLEPLLSKQRSARDLRTTEEGVDAVVYKVPDKNIVVRFSNGTRLYHHDHPRMLGSTRPDKTNVMHPFMEFSVPNPKGEGLYIEISALGRDVGQFLADVNARRLAWQGITGRNPNPEYAHRNDFAQAGNNKRFNGRTKLIDTGEMDKHLFSPPSQRTDWKDMDEYKELTPAARAGKWFDPAIHNAIYECQLQRHLDMSLENAAQQLHHIATPHSDGTPRSAETITAQARAQLTSLIRALSQRKGARAENITEALDFVKATLPPGITPPRFVR